MAFKRWQNIPEVQDEAAKLDSNARKYFSLLSTGKTDDKIAAQKLWGIMSSSYWDILFAIVDAQTKANPAQLAFDAEERLFINTGYVHGVLSLAKTFDPRAFLSAKCSAGVFPVMAFSDYIAETWAAITGNNPPEPSIGISQEARTSQLADSLAQAQSARDRELSGILNAASLSQAMNANIIPFMKVNMRVPEYREGTESFRQELAQKRKAFLDAEAAMLLEINSAQKKEDNPLPAPRAAKFLQLHELTRTLAREVLYSQMDAAKSARRMKKITDECSAMSPKMKQSYLRELLVKKREYLTVPGKNARADTSLLCPPDAMPIDCPKNYAILENIARMDIAMFNVPRVRMYGIPRAIFVPGQGLGTYDWQDNSLLLPVFPIGGEDKSVSYALAAYRWDSDEDRKVKNPYEQLKENRKKAMLALAASFYKDYSLWMTKEKQGYRILPSETHKVFVQVFSQKADD